MPRLATRQTLITAAVLASCGAAGTAAAAGTDIGANTTIGGELFSDFSHIQLQNESATGQRVDTAPTGTGFDIKRLYLIVDHRFSDVWAADLTTDAQFRSQHVGRAGAKRNTPSRRSGRGITIRLTQEQ